MKSRLLSDKQDAQARRYCVLLVPSFYGLGHVGAKQGSIFEIVGHFSRCYG
jgi:hypothetical protein